MATLTVTATEDYSDGVPPLSNITTIQFSTAGVVTAGFDASQFDNLQVSQSVTIIGDANQNLINLVGIDGTFSAAGWTLSSWSGADFIGLQGGSGADTITDASASSGSVQLIGNGGADKLFGGTALNAFIYFSDTDLVAGEELHGGSQSDGITLLAPGNYDFSIAELSSIERLDFNGTNTVTLSHDQIGAGAILQLSSGLSPDFKVLTIKGGSADLSPVNFVNWTDGGLITINGTTAADVLIGSSKDDRINGGRGSDTLNGGNEGDTLNGGRGKDILSGGIDADHDIFDFNHAYESKNGKARDVITDFDNGIDDIDVSGIDAKTGVAGNQHFKFIGQKPLHHVKGELHYKLVDASGTLQDRTIVEGDVNGDGKPDFQIQLTGLIVLAASDFVL